MEVTKEVRMQLVGLKALAVHHSAKLDEIAEAVSALVGVERENDTHGWITDFIYDDATTVTRFLKHIDEP